MRKAICILLVLLLAVGACGAAFAEEPPVVEQFKDLEYISLEEAQAQMEEAAGADAGAKQTLEELERMARCAGLFVQERSSSTGKAYTAEVEFCLRYGVPYCQVSYTNYAGDIEEAPVIPADNGKYSFHTEPVGKLYGREQQFSIDIGEEDLHIAWGSSCDYLLDRGTGAVSDYENPVLPFPETQMYRDVVEAADKLFGKTEHRYVYDEESRTLTVYFMAKEGLFNLAYTRGEALRESMDSMIRSLTPGSVQLETLMNLAVRNGMTDYRKGHFSIVMVDKLNEEDEYLVGRDVLFELSNGKVVYDLIEEVEKANSTPPAPRQTAPVSVPAASAAPTPPPQGSSSSGTSFASMGERNALQKAKDYLAFTAFSHSGLIEQLEYEGFSHSEAKYGADHCGADWNEQAAKKAEQYLDFMAFSREGLIEQLEYEGFTHSQAVYGVSRNGY